jgi:hypothetical protein
MGRVRVGIYLQSYKFRENNWTTRPGLLLAMGHGREGPNDKALAMDPGWLSGRDAACARAEVWSKEKHGHPQLAKVQYECA